MLCLFNGLGKQDPRALTVHETCTPLQWGAGGEDVYIVFQQNWRLRPAPITSAEAWKEVKVGGRERGE
jgi:hypothetical protein